ncbi:MAG TPA: DUF1559 domain-containing protein [Fimbriimonas sp.]
MRLKPREAPLSHLKRRAFTLLELVAILFVVMVLAALFFPVYRPHASVRRTQCLSNVKQLGTAMTMYLEDSDRHFPSSAHAAPGADWGPQIAPYLKGNVFHCPMDKTDLPRPTDWPLGAGYCPTHLYSYGLNNNLPGADFEVRGRDRLRKAPVDHASLGRPEKTVLFFEVADAVGRIFPRERPIDAESPTGNTTNNPLLAHVPGAHPGQSFPDGISPDPTVLHSLYAIGNVGGRILNGGMGSVPRHEGRANYAFADGHARNLAPEAVSGGSDAVDGSCDQGTAARQTGPCAKQRTVMAAGTANERYMATFSSK